MITTKATYFNGYMWHMVLFPDGARAVWPTRMDGRPLPGVSTRYYHRNRRPLVRTEHRQLIPAARG